MAAKRALHPRHRPVDRGGQLIGQRSGDRLGRRSADWVAVRLELAAEVAQVCGRNLLEHALERDPSL